VTNPASGQETNIASGQETNTNPTTISPDILYITYADGKYSVSTTEITGSTKVVKQNGCWTIEGSSSVVANNNNNVLNRIKSSLPSFSLFKSKEEKVNDLNLVKSNEQKKTVESTQFGGKSKTKKRNQKRRGFKSRSKK
jgi:hypothetical protein